MVCGSVWTHCGVGRSMGRGICKLPTPALGMETLSLHHHLHPSLHIQTLTHPLAQTTLTSSPLDVLLLLSYLIWKPERSLAPGPAT